MFCVQYSLNMTLRGCEDMDEKNNQKGLKHIKYDIATNFDAELIEGISRLNMFDWVYGKMNNDMIGGGRPSILLPKISWNMLQEHINLCHRHKIKFNYLMNALCLGNQEFQKTKHKSIVRLLDKLSNMGVDGITVASPYLCTLIKKQFPHLFVSISIYAKIRTLTEIKYWTNLGADEITLYHNVNRNFQALRQYLSYVKTAGPRLRLIANNSCLHDCPFHANHAVAHSHASRKGDNSSKFHIDYQILQCNRLKVEFPTKLISSEWIRPEDVHYYDALCQEAGTDKLVLKLTERGRTTKWLLRVADAYASQSYEGNLLDILNYTNNRENKQIHTGLFYINALMHLYNFKGLFNLRNAIFSDSSLYIDNKKLDGFIDRFVSNFDCENRICVDGDGVVNEQAKELYCKYCGHWAEKAITIDETKRKQQLVNYYTAIDDLNSSKMFSIGSK